MTDPPAQVIPFKVIGLQRTGTNLMVALLARNFHVHSLEIGAEWKHGPVEQPDRQWNNTPARFVLCVKNPYAWLTSCFRYFRVATGADSTVAPQFVRDPAMPFEEFVLTPSYEFASPMHRWNQMYKLWLTTLPMERTVVVRHEDQLKDQIEVLAEAQQKLGLTPLGRLQGIAERVDVEARLGAPMDRGYYLEREYLSSFSPALLECVNTVLDAQLMDRFRYARES
jgi:hypothetical protein